MRKTRSIFSHLLMIALLLFISTGCSLDDYSTISFDTKPDEEYILVVKGPEGKEFSIQGADAEYWEYTGEFDTIASPAVKDQMRSYSDNLTGFGLYCDKHVKNLKLQKMPELEQVYIMSGYSLENFTLKELPKLGLLVIEGLQDIGLDLKELKNLGLLVLDKASIKELDLQGLDNLFRVELNSDAFINLQLGGNDNLDLINITEMPFTTEQLDDLYSRLPEIEGDEPAMLCVYDRMEPNEKVLDIIHKSNPKVAMMKNWSVVYYDPLDEYEYVPFNLDKFPNAQ